MRTLTRLSLLAGVAVFAQIASATVNYTVLQANVGYQNGDHNDLSWQVDGNAITFTSIPPVGVGDGFFIGNGHAAATVTIIYTVTSDKAINGLDLIFNGDAEGKAQLGYTELVENWDGQNSGAVIASTSGFYKGGGLTGGADGGFSNDTFLSFANGPVFSYKVKKTFTLLDLDGQDPAASSVTLGLVEQNAVPEPASMGALAVGALGLLARRRRK